MIEIMALKINVLSREMLTAEFTLDNFSQGSYTDSDDESTENGKWKSRDRRESKVSLYARKTIMSLIGVSKVHQSRIGSDNMRQRELERIM